MAPIESHIQTESQWLIKLEHICEILSKHCVQDRSGCDWVVTQLVLFCATIPMSQKSFQNQRQEPNCQGIIPMIAVMGVTVFT